MIPRIKTVLFTTDLSENSRHAFHYAASVAARYDGDLIMLHVMEKLQVGVEQRLADFFGEEKWRQIRKDHEQQARDILIGKQKDHEIIRKALNAFCDSSNSDAAGCSFRKHEVVIREGKVVEEIVKLAREKECDLLVMGAHKGLLGATTVGSITKSVLHLSNIPVLVVPPFDATRSPDA